MRTFTAPVQVTGTDGRTYTQITTKRACNGCGAEIGDANDAEIQAAMTGQPLPDVRGECPTCSPAAFAEAFGGRLED